MRAIRYVSLISLTLFVFIPRICLGSSEASESIKIGAAFALSGIAAPFGTAEANAARLAVDEVNSSGGVNGRKLELVLEDTQSTQVGTVNAVTKLVTLNKVAAIVGPTWLDSFGGAIPIAERHGTLLITPSAVPGVMKKTPSDFPIVFSTFFNVEKELDFLLERIVLEGKKQIALLFDEDPFFQWIHAGLRSKATKKGLEIVEDVSISVGSTELRASLTRIKESQAQAILFGFMDGGSLMSFLKSRKALLPSTKLFGIHDVEGYSADPEYKSLFALTAYAAPVAASEEFRSKYHTEYDEAPKLTASNTYDAVMILAKSLEKSAGNWKTVPEVLRKNDFQTVTFGNIRFDALGGVNGGQFEIKEID